MYGNVDTELKCIETVLRRDQLPLPDRPKVLDIQFRRVLDSMGEPALYITVVLDDATPDEDRRWAMLKPIRDAVQDTIWNAGIDRYPYVSFATASELAEAG